MVAVIFVSFDSNVSWRFWSSFIIRDVCIYMKGSTGEHIKNCFMFFVKLFQQIVHYYDQILHHELNIFLIIFEKCYLKIHYLLKCRYCYFKGFQDFITTYI